MARVFVSDLADADTARILDDLTRNAGHALASRYDAAIEDFYARLSGYPESCQASPHLAANVCVGSSVRKITRRILRGG